MNKKVFIRTGIKTIAGVLLICFGSSKKVNAQFTVDDVTVEVRGLSEEMTARFKNHKNVEILVNRFNELGVSYSLSPIKYLFLMRMK